MAFESFKADIDDGTRKKYVYFDLDWHGNDCMVFRFGDEEIHITKEQAMEFFNLTEKKD